MSKGLKFVIGAVLLFAIAVGGEFAFLYHRNHADDKPVAKSTYKSDPDDLVFVKKEHPMSLKDAKDLKGRSLWISAGGQMSYYPYNGKTVDFTKPEGVLLGAEKIVVQGAVEQVVPAKDAIRIPKGDKQVLLVFQKPTDAKEYAVPVGFVQAGEYTFSTDDIFFYEDPHTLFAYWGPQVWQAIDEHHAALGMTEREAMMALGQVVVPHGDKEGDRTMDFLSQGIKPVKITFEGGKATKIVDLP